MRPLLIFLHTLISIVLKRWIWKSKKPYPTPAAEPVNEPGNGFRMPFPAAWRLHLALCQVAGDAASGKAPSLQLTDDRT